MTPALIEMLKGPAYQVEEKAEEPEHYQNRQLAWLKARALRHEALLWAPQ